MTMLSKNGLIEGVHGKGGGYRLYRAPDDYKAGDILRVTEGCSPCFLPGKRCSALRQNQPMQNTADAEEAR